MKLKKSMLLLFIITIISLRCDTTEPPENKASLTLTLEDVSCTEAWLTLKTTNIPLPTSVVLKQNDAARMTITLTTADTLLYVDSLLPKQTYSFQVTSIQNPVSSLSSNKVPVATLDTTSHNFTWQTFTFGQHSSSVLYDVAIIDENNIWAVGKIYMNDSLGNPDPHAYNAVHWDGSVWTVKKVTVLFRGSLITPPLEGVFAFSNTDIWFIGSLPIHGDGNNWIMYDLRTNVDPNLSLSRAWGTNSTNMYFVGRSGSIAHYNGSSWTKIESGTDVRLNDVCGKTSHEKIFASGYNPVGSHKSSLIQIITSDATEIWNTANNIETPPYGLEIGSIWLVNDVLFVSSNEGVYKENTILNTIPRKLFSVGWKVYKITGTQINDVYTVGDWSNIFHYNGMISRQIYYDYTTTNTLYSGIAKGRNIVSVGTEIDNAVLNKALIIVGKRQ